MRAVIAWMAEIDRFRYFPNADRITLRMLLEHTSGVPEWIDPDVRRPGPCRGYWWELA